MIKLFALDVDGTLTDGGVYMDGKGGEFKRFDIQDGYGIRKLIDRDIKVFFISGRYSPATQQRAEDLRVTGCVNGTKDKLSELKTLAENYHIEREEVAFAGDDIPDIECIEWAGLGIAVANAVSQVVMIADWKTESTGGHGAIRECAEKIIQINGDRSE
ncbi:MAG: HAD hydrolase family protein [Synergistaceae bacterium]|nr:HAD hydrolase family protein [Synergistaceae bacterium]